MLRRAWSVFRSRWVEVLGISGLALPLGVLLGCGLVGLVGLVWGLSRLCWTLTEEKVDPRTFAGGVASGTLLLVLAIFHSLIWFLALTCASAMVEAEPRWLHWLIASGTHVASSVLLGLFLSPWMFAPLLIANERLGLGAALRASEAIVGSAGWQRTARVGLVSAGVFSLPFCVFAAICAKWPAFSSPIPQATIALVLIFVVAMTAGMGPALCVIAGEYRRVRARWRSLEVHKISNTSFVALGGVSLIWIALVGVCLSLAMRPTTAPNWSYAGDPMAEGPAATWGRPVAEPVQGLSELRLPGTSVTVRAANRRYVRVEAADGGGAGDIPVDWYGDVLSDLEPTHGEVVHLLAWETARSDGRRNFVLTFEAGGVVHGVRLDERGVRLDDGIRERVLARFGWSGGILILFALLASLTMVGRLGAAAARARSLRAASLFDPDSAPGLRALVGKLQASPHGPPIVLHRRRLYAPGARIEAEDGHVQLVLPDRPIELVAPVPRAKRGELAHETEVVVLSRFAATPLRAPRDAAIPLPQDAWLLVGSSSRAADALLSRALFEAHLTVGVVVVATIFAIGVALLS